MGSTEIKAVADFLVADFEREMQTTLRVLEAVPHGRLDYRPDDVALARRIHRLLNQDGYTIRGVQQLLARGGRDGGDGDGTDRAEAPAAPAAMQAPGAQELRALRDSLVEALEDTAL